MWTVLALAALVSAEPVRWVPVAFEQAAWVRQSPPELLTDLGRFRWDGGTWAYAPRQVSPIVPMLDPAPSAAVGDELVIAAGTAAVQLADKGKRLFIVRPALGPPVAIDLPSADELFAGALRFLVELPDAWLIEGVATAGDAQLGVFLLRLAKATRGSAFLKPLGAAEMLPAFAQTVAFDGAHWFLPASGSESQEAWVLKGGRWERRAPPTPESVLLDAFTAAGGLYLAYSNGIAVVAPGALRWHPLAAEFARPAWVCMAPQVAPVRGRWLRGDEIIGWSVGSAAPDPDYPLDGTSCAFFTSAAAAQGLLAPTGVKISLTTAGAPPVTR